VLTVYPGPVESDMEAAARQSFKGDMANNLPTGTPQELADVVWKAIQKRSARLVYPRVYGLTRYLRVTSEWVTRTFSPQLVDD
ncbi:MAG: NAD-dependent epimerase, partial [Myxococcota bacterium]